MVKKIRTIDEIRPNVFEALKRAYVNMGLVRRPKKLEELEESAQSAKPEPKQSEPKQKSGKAGSPDKEMDEKSNAKQPKTDETIHDIVDNADDVLYEASSVFPFTLVPDTIKLDREKLTIANRYFWKTANITSTPVSEIMSCETTVGPIFGSIHLTFRFFTDNVREIKFFWREDAINFQRMMHGYIIAQRKEIDVSHIPTEELKELLNKLGTGASD